MKNYVFLGPPGAGKGTMAEMLCERFAHVHISTGDILRQEMHRGSALGRQAKGYVDAGELVPDGVVAAIVSDKLSGTDVRDKGFVLDGYPRTVPQADLLEVALKDQAIALDKVVLFEVDEALLLKRLTARRVCKSCGAVFNVMFNPPAREDICDKCGGGLYQRRDDMIETAHERLGVYRRETEPLTEYYDRRGLLLRVIGYQERHRNFATLLKHLGIPQV